MEVAGQPASIGILEFMILDPLGRFFERRVLEEDTEFIAGTGPTGTKAPPIGTYLQPIYQMAQVAEALRVGTIFSDTLKYDQSKTSLVFDFKWTGLKGRTMRVWNMPQVSWFETGECHDIEREARVQLNAGANDQQIIDKTIEALQPLFRAFGGRPVPKQSVEFWITRLLNRQ